jgi:hypothetical protein
VPKNTSSAPRNTQTTPTRCLSGVSIALENAVAAAALFVSEEFVKSHWSKAAVARKLSRRHKLADVSGLLADLNEARKGTAYGDEDEPEISPEEVLENVGNYIVQVDALLAGKKG